MGHESTQLTIVPNQDTQHKEIYTKNTGTNEECTVYWDVTVDPVPVYSEEGEIEKRNNYMYLEAEKKGQDKAYSITPENEVEYIEVFKDPHTHIRINSDPLKGTEKAEDGYSFARAGQILKGYGSWSEKVFEKGTIETWNKELCDVGTEINAKEIEFSDPIGVSINTFNKYCDGDIVIRPILGENYRVTYPYDTNGNELIRKSSSVWTIDDFNNGAEYGNTKTAGIKKIEIVLPDVY